MARKKTTRRRRTTKAATTRRRGKARKKKGSDRLINFFVPLFLMVCIVSALGAVLFMGFQTAAASSIFEIQKIEIHGVRNVSKKRVESMVRHAAGPGVWDANLERIREEVSRIDYIRHVSVSRVLPGTIRVMVDERRPVGLVRTGGNIYRVDRDARLLEQVPVTNTARQPFVMLGWDADLSQKARKDNKKRMDLYLDLLDEWQRYDLAKRVIAVDMSNLRGIDAIISDSGKRVALSLGSEDFGNRLREGIKHAAGKGDRVSRIILDGPSPVIVYRD